MDRLNALKLWASEQFEAMSARDRMLATGLIGLIAMMLVAAMTWFLLGVIADEASRVRLAKERLGETHELSAEYRTLTRKIAAAEARMGQFKATQINTYLEGWATTAGVLPMLKEVRETGTQVVGIYRERDYRVEIKDATLPGLLTFLYAVETSPYPISVKEVDFDVDERKDERVISMGLQLVTYSKEEG